VRGGVLYVDENAVADFRQDTEYVSISGDGNLFCDSKVIVEGQFAGSINADKVIINGEFTGKINANKVTDNR
jgi:hypothetical protein